MAYIVPREIPSCCIECPFIAPFEYVPDGRCYKRITRCILAPKEIEDPWRDAFWTIDNKEDWCPLKEVVEQEDESDD